ncbi:ribonuclease H-like domain-containing protein, partial [Tanacetum coccineum]
SAKDFTTYVSKQQQQQQEWDAQVEDTIIDEDEVIPEEETPEQITVLQDVDKRNTEEYAYHLEQTTNFIENQIFWESRQEDIRRRVPRPLVFFGPQRNTNEPPRITEVVRITTDQPHGLDFMEQIIVMRENDRPNSFSEANFKYLNKNDIEDLYYLCRNKKVNYRETKLMNSLITFIRRRVIWERVHDFQLGIKSYQIKINLIAPTLTFPGIEAHEPYLIVDKPFTGLIYLNNKDEKRVMYLTEIVKFCDATLEKVLKEDLSLRSVLGTGSQCEGLGHPADPVLNGLKNSLQIDNIDKHLYCEVCQRAKQTREPFALSFPLLAKFGGRYEKCVMIGYFSVKKGYRLYSLDKHQFIFSRDVKFFENNFPFKDSDKVKNDTANVFQDVNHINFFDLEYSEIPNDDERVDPKLNSDNKSQSASSSSSESGRTSFTADFLVNSINDADSSDNFFATHDERVTTLEENIFSEELPKGRKAIGSKWIYNIKYQSSGEIDIFKARLVAQGFSQKEGIDYEETFSPVVKMVTVRCLLNIVVSMSWHVFQLDLNNAFLYGDLKETVYMKPPEGYFPSDNKVCRLKKSLYGLKQAPRQWNANLTSTLIENGFSQSKYDYYLYTKADKGVFLALLVYVDDIIITGLGIHIVKDSGISLTAYSDAYWAKCTKQKTLSKSSTKAEYRALASVTSEAICILKILKDLNIENLLPINLHYIFTKGLETFQHKSFVEKLGLFDIYQVEIKGGC